MNQKLLALYGLKWNPFSPELPTEAIYVPPKIENFWMKQLAIPLSAVKHALSGWLCWAHRACADSRRRVRHDSW
jgi:hypothetical protein